MPITRYGSPQTDDGVRVSLLSPLRDTAPRLSPWIVAALLGVNLLLKLWVALRPLETIDSLTLPDDAYLSLQIARNIAHGLGPLYGDVYTNGFQPLYVLLMAPVYAIVQGDAVLPVHIALGLLALFDTLSLLLLTRLTQALGGSRDASLLVAAAWIFNSYVLVTTLNGLETAIAFCFIVASALQFTRLHADPTSRTSGRWLGLGLLLGLAVLSRIDGLILVAALAIALLARLGLERTPWPSFLWALALVGLGIGLVNAPWLAWSYGYTGEMFPISGRAVRFMSLAEVKHQPTVANFYLPMVRKALSSLWYENLVVLKPLVILAVIAALLTARKRITPATWRQVASRLAPFLLYSALLVSAYAFYIFAPWFFGRYLFPVVLVLLMALALTADTVAHASRRPRIVFGLLIFAVIATGVAQPRFRALYQSPVATSRGYLGIARWAESHFAPGTVIGSSQTGALAYFADKLKVVNLDGVVNKPCFDSLVAGRNLAYIRHQNIAFILGWPVNIRFIREHSSQFQPTDLQPIQRVEGVRSWDFDWYVYRVMPAAREP